MSKPKLFNRYALPIVPAKLIELANKFEKLILYGTIGGGAVIIDVGLFWLLDRTGMNPLLNNAISIFAAMLYSFLMNAYFNFRTTSGLLKRFVSFSFVTGCGFVISSLMLWVMSDVLHVDAVIVKTLTLPVVFIVQFTLNSKFTFKQSKQEDTALESIR